jgi:hypothetical protein
MRPKSLYVETVIRTDLDTLWQHTQDPALHRRWDLRFAGISPIDGHDGHFRYASRFLGVTVTGVGASAASRAWPDGSRTSVLRFASADPLSLISAGRRVLALHTGQRRRPLLSRGSTTAPDGAVSGRRRTGFSGRCSDG